MGTVGRTVGQNYASKDTQSISTWEIFGQGDTEDDHENTGNKINDHIDNNKEF